MPDGHYEEITSQQALDEIAEKIESIIKHHGPGAIATYTGTGGIKTLHPIRWLELSIKQ